MSALRNGTDDEPESVAIILLPQNIIGEQQVKKCDEFGITRPIHLIAEVLNHPKSKEILEDII